MNKKAQTHIEPNIHTYIVRNCRMHIFVEDCFFFIFFCFFFKLKPRPKPIRSPRKVQISFLPFGFQNILLLSPSSCFAFLVFYSFLWSVHGLLWFVWCEWWYRAPHCLHKSTCLACYLIWINVLLCVYTLQSVCLFFFGNFRGLWSLWYVCMWFILMNRQRAKMTNQTRYTLLWQYLVHCEIVLF